MGCEFKPVVQGPAQCHFAERNIGLDDCLVCRESSRVEKRGWLAETCSTVGKGGLIGFSKEKMWFEDFSLRSRWVDKPT